MQFLLMAGENLIKRSSDFSLEKYTRGVYEELHMALRMNLNIRP